MQMPPAETIPTLPDGTDPGTVPPMGPSPTAPDQDDVHLPGEDDAPGQNPGFPPDPAPFPDHLPPPGSPQSL